MSDTSQAYFGYKDAKDYARKTIGGEFPNPKVRIKFNKVRAERYVELGHLAGEADVALFLMNYFIENVNQPYDEILGELQLLVRERWNTLSNELSRKGSFSMKPVDVEKLLEQSAIAIQKIREEREDERKRYRSDLAGVTEKDGGGFEVNVIRRQ